MSTFTVEFGPEFALYRSFLLKRPHLVPPHVARVHDRWGPGSQKRPPLSAMATAKRTNWYSRALDQVEICYCPKFAATHEDLRTF